MASPSDTAYYEWPHAPAHLFVANTAYLVTAGTHGKALLFDTPAKLDFLLSSLFTEASRLGWELQAWAVMANHYHFIGVSPETPGTLRELTRSLHSKTARWLNQQDEMPGRKVWFQYWDTCLTYERSYLARLIYVHQNAVKHGLVRQAEEYRWCSMAWFARQSGTGFYRTVRSFKTDGLRVRDDY